MKRTRLKLSDALKETGPKAAIEEIVAAAPGGTTYTHPSTHPASMIETTTTRRFTSDTEINGKQGVLVSGTSIKTINNGSILGSGNIEISGSGLTHAQVMSRISY